MPYLVSLEKCNSYNQNEVDKSVKRLLVSLGGINKFVKNNQKVLLKPNIVKGMKPEECGTTHPAIVESIIKILKENDCEVFLGDDPFSDEITDALKICGIYDVCKNHNVKIANFNKKIIMSYKDGIIVKEFPVSYQFKNVDVIINLPKLKTHSQLYFTGAVKNLYSMMPGPRRGFYHLKYHKMEFFANMLLDIYALLRKKVVLNVMDGIYGMEGNGPCNGNKKFAGILAASSDAVALDFAMCSLIGLDVNKLSTIFYAKKRKDYLFSPDKIKIVGEKNINIKSNPFAEAEYHTLNMMPKFVNKFRDYILKHESEIVYQ